MSKNEVTQLLAQFDIQQAALLEEFFTFLRFKSISTDGAFTQDVRACSGWVQSFLKECGFDVEVWETSGHPVVFAQWLKAGPDKPTVLFYQHYDVQPVDPLELWDSPPFEPVITDGQIFARGAQDNKGQCFYVLCALRALLRDHGSLPLNVKLCIEGEEEAGSAGLSAILPERAAALSADYFFVPDVTIHALSQPAVTLGFRGLVCFSLTVTASAVDLHSGGHGGVAYNANRVLAELLAMLRDQKTGKVTIPGFYDDVEALTAAERSELDLSFDFDDYRATFGALPNGGEIEFSPVECGWLRPTIEINGMSGGYTGDGFKTVIPAKAYAKISCRIVPKQDPQRIAALVSDFLQAHIPEGVTLTIDAAGHGEALRISPNNRAVKAVAAAYEQVCGVPAKNILTGGTIPVAAALSKACGAETVLFGYGLPSDNIHAPNEHFGVDRLKYGFATVVTLLKILGADGK